ncbi:MAG: hypothetical protein IPJ77_09815 [Planctomycetes bacterium]|nr:hypothetical protein [Planctomycetota bacterium]
MEARDRNARTARGVSGVVWSARGVLGLATLAWALPMQACGGGEVSSVQTIAPSRVVESPFRPAGDASTAERFGVASTPSAKSANSTGASVAGTSGLAWDTPRGWTELAPSSMRVASFRVAGDAKAECYLTLLGGDGGGLAANVNRWRTQLGLAPLGPDEVEALPRAELFGGPAVLFDATGSYQGMNADGAVSGARLVGLLRVEPGGSAFLKMIGPASTLASELDAFHGLARSFRTARSGAAQGSEAQGAGPSDHPGAQVGTSSTSNGPTSASSNSQTGSTSSAGTNTRATSDGSSSTTAHASSDGAGAMPHASVGAAPREDALQTAIEHAPARLTWTAPEGWRVGPERATRLVTFLPDDSGLVECYVTTLAGEAGGELANVNRWRGQLGARPWSSDELAAAPRAKLLGAQPALLELEGALKRDSGAPLQDAKLLAVARTRSSTSVFVKMTGPKERVNALRGAFLAFCASLDEVR